MKVNLEGYSDLFLCSDAIRECHNTKEQSDKDLTECNSIEDEKYHKVTAGEKDKALINRVGNKMKHSSTLEHLSYTFSINGISRAVLQELARHRMASLTVKSSRYTLKELLKEEAFIADGFVNDYQGQRAELYIVLTSNRNVNLASVKALEELRLLIRDNVSNDIAKYCMPECYKTSLTWTINARSLQNFLELRTGKAALWEIQNLARAIFEALPKEHKFLFENHVINLEDKADNVYA